MRQDTERRAGGAAGSTVLRRLTIAREPQDAPRGVVAPSYGWRDFVIRRLLALADVTGIVVSLSVALSVVGGGDSSLAQVLWGFLVLPAWVILFKAYGLYERDIKRVSHTTLDDLPWLFHALVVGGLLMWGYYQLVPIDKVVFKQLFWFSLLAMPAILILRALVRRVAARVLGAERVLMLGESETTDVLVRKMRSHPEYRLDPVGILTSTGAPGRASALPVLGGPADFEQVAEEHGVERIVVAHTKVEDEALLEVIRRCKFLSIKVSVLPQLFDAMGPSVEIDDVEGVTVLGINPPVLSRSSRIMKRAIDVVGSAVALVLFSPVILAIAIAVKVDSRGPVFFKQDRVGRAGRRFRLIKFRTMVTDAEAQVAELRALSRDPNWLHLDHDPRITRVGRFLRLTSLDELPQLWNVLKGDMSLVGPRPLIEAEDSLIGGWARSRLDLTPGLTGSWQVLGRTNIAFEEMVKLDYLYVTNWTLWTDIRLILRTLPAVVKRRGAN